MTGAIDSSGIPEATGSEVAVVGMSGRFPGARNLDEFWRNLRDGVESLSFFSDRELLESGLDPALIADPNFVKAGMVLEDADLFDGGFFGYSPREAEMIDPQHRVFLECVWEALEDAGCDPQTYPGSIGIYAGAGLTTYLMAMMGGFGSSLTATLSNFQAMIANDKDFLATRTAYKLNLRGPAITVQTACSTSLVAVHLACQSLWSGECDMALAGGVSIYFPQKAGHVYNEGMIASPDGRCRAFDARAQGTIKGNGAGVVVLKRLSDAHAAGDSIRAIIRGSAVNNDGSLKLGYTAPSIEGQAEVVAEALSVAGVAPGTLGYIETHGTGTPLGDPIEVAALTQVFRAQTKERGFCALGSLKTNVGHLDTAAGVGSLIKTVLALEHRQIPPSLHFEQPNPQIDFESSPFYVNGRLREWLRGKTPRRAGVSSFGIGGTNAHVVLEESPEPSPAGSAPQDSLRPAYFLPLSARSAGALRELACAFEQLLKGAPPDLLDICYSASLRRTHHDHRLAVVGRSAAELAQRLGAFREGKPAEGVAYGRPAMEPDDSPFDGLPGDVRSLAIKYVAGSAVDWRSFYPSSGRYVRLPTYPWQRQRYWIASATPSPRDLAAIPETEKIHPLLGARLRSPALSKIVFEHRLSASDPRYLEDHCVFGEPVFPAACYIEIALAAAAHALGPGLYRLEGLALEEALRLPLGERRTLQVILDRDGEDATVRIYSRQSAAGAGEALWIQHASGMLRPRQPDYQSGEKSPHSISESGRDPSLENLRAACPELWEFDGYSRAREHGVDYGPSFRGVARLWRGAGQALGEIRLSEGIDLDAHGYRFHPALLDASLQVAGAAMLAGNGRQETQPYLPIALDSVEIYRSPGDRMWSYARIHGSDSQRETVRADIRIFSEDGGEVADLRGLVLKRASRATLRRRIEDPLYQVIWQSRPPEAPSEVPSGRWLIFADSEDPAGLGMTLATLLESRGDACLRVTPGERYERVGASSRRIDPADPGSFVRLLEEARADADLSCRGVVFLWGVGATPDSVDSLHTAQSLACRGALHILQALSRNGTVAPPPVWIVTRGACSAAASNVSVDPTHAPLWGLARTATIENPTLRCTTIDLDPEINLPSQAGELFQELLAGGGEEQVALRGGGRLVPRLVPLVASGASRPIPLEGVDSNFRLEMTRRGVLDNLVFRSSARKGPSRGEVEIRVGATGLNFRDVLSALDLYPGEMSFGGECAGTIVTVGEGVEEFRIGDAVVAIAANCFSAFATAPAHLVAHKPESLSFEEAASIPIVFLTAHYGLHHLAQIARAERVLIHAAAGGVGLAAVKLAHLAGAEVFATAGSPEKRQFLRSLGVAHVFDSRSLEFADEIRSITGERGVEVVLNSLSGEFIARSLSVLGRGGRFLEIGKLGIWPAEEVARERGDVSYFPYDLEQAARETPKLLHSMFTEIIGQFKEGRLAPLPRRVFGLSEVSGAFRFMAQARHIGKIVVTQQEIGEVGARFREDGTYLITGGTGALGLRLARWMVEEGARNIVLSARHAPPAEARASIEELQSRGAKILVEQADTARLSDMTALLGQIDETLPELRGIFHAAGVVDDAVLAEQSWERFRKVFESKVDGAWILHELTRGRALDYFVFFSSMASLFGSPGQANYAAANAYLDALAHRRRSEGLAGLSVNWGPWQEGGMAARMSSTHLARRKAQGIGTLEGEEALELLGRLLGNGPAQVAALSMEWSTFLRQYPREPRLFGELQQVKTRVNEEKSRAGELRNLLDQTPAARRRAVLLKHLRDTVVQVLGLDPSQTLDDRQGLSDLGMDSLMSIELRNRLQESLGHPLHSTLSFDYPTIEELADYLAREVLHESVEPPAASPVVSAAGISETAVLSGEQLVAAMERELAGIDDLLEDRP